MSVFAVEDTSIQVSWSGLDTRRLTVEVGDRRASVDVAPPAWLYHRAGRPRRLDPRPGGPGTLVVDGLSPDTRYPVWAHGPGMDRVRVATIRTLAPPPGELLTRFVTVSDTHIGERRFGAFGDIVEDPRHAGPEPYPVRCLRAALDEARTWGGTLVVAKGDLTDRTSPYELATARRLLLEGGMDCVAQLGNHDSARHFDVDTELAGIDTAGPGRIVVRDLPGLRIVAGHTPIFRDRAGALDHRAVEAIADAAAAAPGPAVVTLHHPPRRWPVPLYYPPGLDREASRRLTAALRAANPATIVLAGHSHRHRRYRVDGLEVVEVGSTKDYPGVWAGYAVHEGGIRQVVRRLAPPDIVAWTEATACAVGGQWGRWSPGRLDERCWSLTWPRR